MANPVFNNSPVFQDPVQRRGQKSAASTVSYGTAGAQTADAATLDTLYNAPSATTRDTGRLTYDDVIIRTGGLLAAARRHRGRVLVPHAVDAVDPLGRHDRRAGPRPGQRVPQGAEPAADHRCTRPRRACSSVASATCSRTTWSRARRPARPRRSSRRRSSRRSPTFAGALFLFRSGKVRVTPKFTRWLLIGLVGYLIFSLANFVASFFLASDGYGPFRNGIWGVLAGLVGVGLAAASLIVDFDSIKRGVEKGAPGQVRVVGRVRPHRHAGLAVPRVPAAVRDPAGSQLTSCVHGLTSARVR